MTKKIKQQIAALDQKDIDKVIDNNKAINITSTEINAVTSRIDKINQMANIIKNQLKNNIDYGIIKGTKKPSLYKSGALKIKMLYGLQDTYTIIKNSKGYNGRKKWEEEWMIKCELYTFNDNLKVAEGIGHISSLEKQGMANFERPTNTLIKMAKKRAMVDAVVSIGALSEIFTQDVEDMVPIFNASPNEKIAWKKDKLTKKQKELLRVKIHNLLEPITQDLPTCNMYINKATTTLGLPNIDADNFNKIAEQQLLTYLERSVKSHLAK